MDNSTKVILSFILVCVVICVSPFFFYMGYHNREVRLRNQFVAQQKLNEGIFDTVWKTVQQQSEVATTERETFKETFTEIMESQQGIAGSGTLASFFTQAKVDVSPDLFNKLMTSIESQRMMFLDGQKKLLQVKKDHDDILNQLPSSLFVGGRDSLEAQIVTSAKTDEVFKSGKEEDIQLFTE